MGNINSAVCNYNICSDDLYELDWFSKHTWDIYVENSIYKNKINIKKGVIHLSDIGNTSMLFKRNINIHKNNITKLLIPFQFSFKCEKDFTIIIVLSNSNNNLQDINNLSNELFYFEIKCINNKIYFDTDNNNYFDNNDKNLLNIMYNFEHKNILNSNIQFIHNNNTNKNSNNDSNILFELNKNKLFYDTENIYIHVFIKINCLENNEYIKIHL